MYWSEDEDIAVVWKDNNIVKVLSNHQGIEPIQKVSCYSRSEKKKFSLPQQNCISDYNKYMGGVDKMYRMVNKYRIKIKSKKYHFPTFTNLIDMTIVNAHVLFEIGNGKIPLLEFRRFSARTYL